MGLGSFIDEVGDAGGRLVDSAERAAGGLIEEGARKVADGLDHVGLHKAAQWTSHTGDRLADDLGAHVPEQQLGESDDPRDLLHGDAGRIRAAAGHLRRLHGAFDAGRTGLSRLDPGDWDGWGADAFRARFTRQPAAWSHAADSCGQAADALDTYAFTVEWARGQATEALRQWKRGVAARTKAVAAHNAKVRSYNAAVAAGADAPAAPGPFTDPGAGDRTAARELLAAAREQRDAAAAAARSAVRSATGLAPELPGFSDRWKARAGDWMSTAPIHFEHFAGGLLRSGADMVRFARGLDPFDSYNATHPAAYLTHLNSTAAGLLDLAARPERLPAALLGTAWGSDTDEAAGRLFGSLLLGGQARGDILAGRDLVPWRKDAVAGRGTSLQDIRESLRGGDDGLQPVKASDQLALERAVPRNPDGSFQRHPDPFTKWTSKQNDGGHRVRGRANNCADGVRAALETWYGNPQVSAARTVTRMPDGRLDKTSGERNGVQNGEAWGGTRIDYTGHGAAAYDTVADQVRKAGHGSSALVHVEWPRRRGESSAHVFTALNHNGRVVWFDPQTGQVSTKPIHLHAAHVFHYVLDADRRPVRRPPVYVGGDTPQ
jgi:hypothetical protein